MGADRPGRGFASSQNEEAQFWMDLGCPGRFPWRFQVKDGNGVDVAEEGRKKRKARITEEKARCESQ